MSAVCCVGIGRCDELIILSGESYYRVCVCVSNCVWYKKHRNEAA